MTHKGNLHKTHRYFGQTLGVSVQFKGSQIYFAVFIYYQNGGNTFGGHAVEIKGGRKFALFASLKFSKSDEVIILYGDVGRFLNDWRWRQALASYFSGFACLRLA